MILQVDATDFSEIATNCTEGRCVLDLCVDAADAFIGVVAVEPNELMSSSARVYEVGRRRIQVGRCHSLAHAKTSAISPRRRHQAALLRHRYIFAPNKHFRHPVLQSVAGRL